MVWIVFTSPEGLEAAGEDGVAVQFMKEELEEAKKVTVYRRESLVRGESLVLVKVSVAISKGMLSEVFGSVKGFLKNAVGVSAKETIEVSIDTGAEHPCQLQIPAKSLSAKEHDLICFVGGSTLGDYLRCVYFIATIEEKEPFNIFNKYEGNLEREHAKVSEVLASYGKWETSLPWDLTTPEDHFRASKALSKIEWNSAAQTHLDSLVRSLSQKQYIDRNLERLSRGAPWWLMRNTILAALFKDIFSVPVLDDENRVAPDSHEAVLEEAIEVACSIGALAMSHTWSPQRYLTGNIVYGALLCITLPNIEILPDLPDLNDQQIQLARKLEVKIAIRSEPAQQRFLSWIRRAVVISVPLNLAIDNCLEFFNGDVDDLIAKRVEFRMQKWREKKYNFELLEGFVVNEIPPSLKLKIALLMFQLASDKGDAYHLLCIVINPLCASSSPPLHITRKKAIQMLAQNEATVFLDALSKLSLQSKQRMAKKVNWKEAVDSFTKLSTSTLPLLLSFGQVRQCIENEDYIRFVCTVMFNCPHKAKEAEVLSLLRPNEQRQLRDLFKDIHLLIDICSALSKLPANERPERALSVFAGAFKNQTRSLSQVSGWCADWCDDRTASKVNVHMLITEHFNQSSLQQGAKLAQDGITMLQERGERMKALQSYVNSNLRGHISEEIREDLSEHLKLYSDKIMEFPSEDAGVHQLEKLKAFQRHEGAIAADSVWFHHAAAHLASQSGDGLRNVEDLFELVGNALAKAHADVLEALNGQSMCTVLDLILKTTIEREENALRAILASNPDTKDDENVKNVKRLARLSVATIPILADVRKTPSRLHKLIAKFLENLDSSAPSGSWMQKYGDEGQALQWFGEKSLDTFVQDGEMVLQTLPVEEWPKLMHVEAESAGIQALLSIRLTDGKETLDQMLEQLRSATLVQDPRLTPSARLLSEICHRLDGLSPRGKPKDAVKEIVSLARLLAQSKVRDSSVLGLVSLLKLGDSKPETLLNQNLQALQDAQLELRVARPGNALHKNELCNAPHHTHGVCVQVIAAKGMEFRMMGHGLSLHELGCMELPDMVSQLLIYTGSSGSKFNAARIALFISRVQRARELGDRLHHAMRINFGFQGTKEEWGEVIVKNTGTLRIVWRYAIPQTVSAETDVDDAQETLLPSTILAEKMRIRRTLEASVPWILRLRRRSVAWNEAVALEAVLADPDSARAALRDLHALRAQHDEDVSRALRLVNQALQHKSVVSRESEPVQVQPRSLAPVILFEWDNKLAKASAAQGGISLAHWATRAMNLIGAGSATTFIAIDESFSDLTLDALLVGLREATKTPDRAGYCLANANGLVIVGLDLLPLRKQLTVYEACAHYARAVRKVEGKIPVPVLVLLTSRSINLDEETTRAIYRVMPGSADGIFATLCEQGRLSQKLRVQRIKEKSLVFRAAGIVTSGKRVLLRKGMTIAELTSELRDASKNAATSLRSAKMLVLDCYEDAFEIFESALGVALVGLFNARVVGAESQSRPLVFSQKGDVELILEIPDELNLPFNARKLKDRSDSGYQFAAPAQQSEATEQAAARLEELAEQAIQRHIDESDVHEALCCVPRRGQQRLPFVYTSASLKAMAKAVRSIPSRPGRENEMGHAVVLAGDTGTGKTYLCMKLHELLVSSKLWRVNDLLRIWSFSAAFGHREVQALNAMICEDARTEHQRKTKRIWNFAILDEVTASPAQSSIEQLVRMQGHNDRTQTDRVEREDITSCPLFLVTCNPDPLRDEVFPLAKTMRSVQISLERPPLDSMASFVRANFARFASRVDADVATRIYLIVAKAFESQSRRNKTEYGVLSARDAAQCAAIAGALDSSQECLQAIAPGSSSVHALILAIYLVMGIRMVPRNDFYTSLEQEETIFETERSWSSWFDGVRDCITKAYEVPSTIVPTLAFKENLLVLTLGMLTRQPVLLLGNDGMSKSLSIKLTMRQMRGSLSAKGLLRDHFPRVQSFALQFSPRTSAGLVRQLGNALVALNSEGDSSLGEVLPCAVMEEMSMARTGPDGPLRALHGLLDDHQTRVGRDRSSTAGSGSNTFGFCATSNFLPSMQGKIPVGRALANRILVLVHEKQTDDDLMKMANAAAKGWTKHPLQVTGEQLIKRAVGHVAVRDLLIFARATAQAGMTATAPDTGAVTCAAFLQRRSKADSEKTWKAMKMYQNKDQDDNPRLFRDNVLRIFRDPGMPSRGLLIVYDDVRDLSDWLHELDERLCARLCYCEAYVLDLLCLNLPTRAIELTGATKVSELARLTESDVIELCMTGNCGDEAPKLARNLRQCLEKYAQLCGDPSPLVLRTKLAQGLNAEQDVGDWVDTVFTSFGSLRRERIRTALGKRNIRTPGDLADMSVADFLIPTWREEAFTCLTLKTARCALSGGKIPVDVRDELKCHNKVLRIALEAAPEGPSKAMKILKASTERQREIICVSSWARSADDASQEALLRLRTSIQSGGTAVLVNPEPILDCIHALLNDFTDGETSTLQMGTSFETVSIGPGARLILCMHSKQIQNVHDAVLSRVSVVNSGYPIPRQIPSTTLRPTSVYAQLAARVRNAGTNWPREEDRHLLKSLDDTSGVLSERPGKLVTILSSESKIETASNQFVRVEARDYASLEAFSRALGAALKRGRDLLIDLSVLSQADTVNVFLLLGMADSYHHVSPLSSRLRPSEALNDLFDQHLFSKRRRAVFHVSPLAFSCCYPCEKLRGLVELIEIRDTNRSITSRWPRLVDIAVDATCVADACRELLENYLGRNRGLHGDAANRASAAALARLSVDGVFLKTWDLTSDDDSRRIKAWQQMCVAAEFSSKSLRTHVLENLRGTLFRCADFVVRKTGGNSSITGISYTDDDAQFWCSDEEVAAAIFAASAFPFQQQGAINTEQSSSMMAQSIARTESKRSQFPCSSELFAAAQGGMDSMRNAFPSLSLSRKMLPEPLVRRLVESLMQELTLSWRLQDTGVLCPDSFIKALLRLGDSEPTLPTVVNQFWLWRHHILLLGLVNGDMEIDLRNENAMDHVFEVVGKALHRQETSSNVESFERILRYCKGDRVRMRDAGDLETLVSLWLAFKRSKTSNELRCAIELQEGSKPLSFDPKNISSLVVRLEGVRARLKPKSIARFVENLLKHEVSENLLARSLCLVPERTYLQVTRMADIIAALEDDVILNSQQLQQRLCGALRIVALGLLKSTSLEPWVRFMSPQRHQRIKTMSPAAWRLFCAVFGARVIEVALEQTSVKASQAAPLLRADCPVFTPLRNFTIRKIMSMHGESGMEKSRAHLKAMSPEACEELPWYEPFMNPPRQGVDELLVCVPGFDGGGGDGLWKAFALTTDPVRLSEECSAFEGPALLWNALISPGGTLHARGGGFAMPYYARQVAALTLPGVGLSGLELVRSISDGTSVNRCPSCKFLYSIGNCGMPGSTAKCPGCGNVLGGEFHLFADGRNHGVSGEESEHIVGLPETLESSIDFKEGILEPLEYRVLWLLMLFPLLCNQTGENEVNTRVQQASKAWHAFKAVSGLSSDEEASAALIALLLEAHHRQLRKQAHPQQQYQQNSIPNLALSTSTLILPPKIRARDHRDMLEQDFKKQLRKLHRGTDLKTWLGQEAKKALHRADEELRKHPLVQLRESNIQERQGQSPEGAAEVHTRIFPEACVLNVHSGSVDDDVFKDLLWSQHKTVALAKPLTILAAFVSESGQWSGDRFEELLKISHTWVREVPRVSQYLGGLVVGARKLQEKVCKGKYTTALSAVQGCLSVEESKRFQESWNGCRQGHQFECQRVDDLGSLESLPVTDILILEGKETPLRAMLKTLVEAHNAMVSWMHDVAGVECEEVALFEVGDVSAHLTQWPLLGALVKIKAPTASASLEKELAWSMPAVKFSFDKSWPEMHVFAEVSGSIIRVMKLPERQTLPAEVEAAVGELELGEPVRNLLEHAQACAARFAADLQQGRLISPDANVTLEVSGQIVLQIKIRHLEALQEILCGRLQPRRHDVLGDAFRQAPPKDGVYALLKPEAREALERNAVLDALDAACADISSFPNGELPISELLPYWGNYDDLPEDVQAAIQTLDVPCGYLYAILDLRYASSSAA